MAQLNRKALPISGWAVFIPIEEGQGKLACLSSGMKGDSQRNTMGYKWKRVLHNPRDANNMYIWAIVTRSAVSKHSVHITTFSTRILLRQVVVHSFHRGRKCSLMRLISLWGKNGRDLKTVGCRKPTRSVNTYRWLNWCTIFAGWFCDFSAPRCPCFCWGVGLLLWHMRCILILDPGLLPVDVLQSFSKPNFSKLNPIMKR